MNGRRSGGAAIPLLVVLGTEPVDVVLDGEVAEVLALWCEEREERERLRGKSAATSLPVAVCLVLVSFQPNIMLSMEPEEGWVVLDVPLCPLRLDVPVEAPPVSAAECRFLRLYTRVSEIGVGS